MHTNQKWGGKMGEELNMPSIAEDIARYCESKDIGELGLSLFAHDWPDNDNTHNSETILVVETTTGQLARLLSGQVSCTKEYFSLFAKGKSEKVSRELLYPYCSALESMQRVQIGKVWYMSVLALTPIHFVGTDKNDMCISEVIFSVLRYPATV